MNKDANNGTRDLYPENRYSAIQSFCVVYLQQRTWGKLSDEQFYERV